MKYIYFSLNMFGLLGVPEACVTHSWMLGIVGPIKNTPSHVKLSDVWPLPLMCPRSTWCVRPLVSRVHPASEGTAQDRQRCRQADGRQRAGAPGTTATSAAILKVNGGTADTRSNTQRLCPRRSI